MTVYRSEKLVAILGGGSWQDASVDHLILGRDTDLETLRAEHRSWYDREYLPALRAGERPRYFTLPEWIIHREIGRFAEDEDVEVFES